MTSTNGGNLSVGDGWRSEVGPDGSLRLIKVRKAGAIVGLLAINLFWNGLVGMFTAIGLGWKFPGEYEGPTPGTPGFWLFLSPFLLIGAMMLWGLVHALLGSDEWRVRANELVVSWRTAGLGSSRRYSNAVVILEDPAGGRQSSPVLYLESEGKKRPLYQGVDSERLARLVAARAGWPLQPPKGSMFIAPTGEPVSPRELPDTFSAGHLTVTRTPTALTITDNPPRAALVAAAVVAVIGGGIIYMGPGRGALTTLRSGHLLTLPGDGDWFSLVFSLFPLVLVALFGFFLVRQLVWAIIRMRRGGDLYVFDTAASQFTRNARSLASLGEIRTVRLLERSAGENDPTYQLRVETTAGRKIAVGDPQSERAGMEALADRLGNFLGVEVLHGNRPSPGSISIGS